MTQRKVPQYDKIAIIGVGLIGGSIGLAARQLGLTKSVTGIGRRESSLRTAKEVGAVNATTTDIADGVAEAELIIVCTPVAHIVDHVGQAAASCPPGALITDAGSTKQVIVSQLDGGLSNRRARFVGSHPLAGGHATGPTAADGRLFADRHVVITPTKKTDSTATDEVTTFWQALGANVSRMSPAAHDEALALTSHLPHVIAAALAGATPLEHLSLTAGGWADSTRIAAADVDLWLQILRQNCPHTLMALGNFEKVLSQFRAALESTDDASLRQLLEQGKQHRDALGN